MSESRLDVIDRLCEEDKVHWDQLKKYSNEHFHPNHHHYGFLKKTRKKSTYSLFLYKEPTRSEYFEYRERCQLSISKAQGLKLSLDKNPFFNTKKILSTLLILKKNKAHNFSESLLQKTTVEEKSRDEFPEDVIFFIVLKDDKFRLNNARALEQRWQARAGGKTQFYTILLKDPLNLEKTLSTLTAIKQVDRANKVRICISGHCAAGNRAIIGAYEKNSVTIRTRWDVGLLMRVFENLKIAKTARLFVDLYGCEAGLPSEKNVSFVSQLTAGLKQEGFQHVTVEGSKNLVWVFPEPHVGTLKEVPYNIYSETIGADDKHKTYSLRG